MKQPIFWRKKPSGFKRSYTQKDDIVKKKRPGKIKIYINGILTLWGAVSVVLGSK